MRYNFVFFPVLFLVAGCDINETTRIEPQPSLGKVIVRFPPQQEKDLELCSAEATLPEILESGSIIRAEKFTCHPLSVGKWMPVPLETKQRGTPWLVALYIKKSPSGAVARHEFHYLFVNQAGTVRNATEDEIEEITSAVNQTRT